MSALLAPLPDLKLTPMPTPPVFAVRAMLYEAAADLTGKTPAPRRLRHVIDLLDAVPPTDALFHAGILTLRQAAFETLKRPTLQVDAWHAFSEQVGETSCPNRKHLYAQNVCDEMAWRAVNNEACPFEQGKPCPFGDYYCVERFGAPCDHLTTGLRMAARLYADRAAAHDDAEAARAEARCVNFAHDHLRTWVRPAAEKLFNGTSTDLYRATAVLIDLLIDAEPQA